MRPGSGCVAVKVKADGPTRVLHISDSLHQVLQSIPGEGIGDRGRKKSGEGRGEGEDKEGRDERRAQDKLMEMKWLRREEKSSDQKR